MPQYFEQGLDVRIEHVLPRPLWQERLESGLNPIPGQAFKKWAAAGIRRIGAEQSGIVGGDMLRFHLRQIHGLPHPGG